MTIYAQPGQPGSPANTPVATTITSAANGCRRSRASISKQTKNLLVSYSPAKLGFF
jgi:hypothetical protein